MQKFTQQKLGNVVGYMIAWGDSQLIMNNAKSWNQK